MTKNEALTLLVDETMKVLNEQEYKSHLDRRTKNHSVAAGKDSVQRFIKRHLIEEKRENRVVILFVGQNRYLPENWSIETPSQIKKIVNYIAYKNLAY